MRLLKLTFALLVLLTIYSCATAVPLDRHFYSRKKVGVIIQVDSIRMTKEGGQGLLDIAITPGNRFYSTLKAIEPQMEIEKRLKDEMTKNGPISAIPFCHISVSSIAKDAAKDRVSKYEFGRTSHKLRNEKNAPQEWIKEDLKRFEGTFYEKDKEASYPVVGKLPNGKKYYAEPLFVNNQCMACHGDKITTELKDKITVFYPNDKATGFKLNEFRGLIWVKEK